MPPGGGPPVMHRHDPGEVYYVERGEFTFYIGGADDPDRRRVTARTGDAGSAGDRAPREPRPDPRARRGAIDEETGESVR